MQGVLLINGHELPLRLEPGAIKLPKDATVARRDDRIWVHFAGHTYEMTWRDAVNHHAASADDADDADARAPMPGSVIAVSVSVGDTVASGDPLMTIESMKLETVIRAPRAGEIAEVCVAEGASFERDAILVRLVETA